jgi:hypothetical protein
LQRSDLVLVLPDELLERLYDALSFLPGRGIVPGRDEFVLANGIDGLLVGAADFGKAVAQVGVGGNRLSRFLNKDGGGLLNLFWRGIVCASGLSGRIKLNVGIESLYDTALMAGPRSR